ncbi:peroxiredoxin [candidate division KSB1 bacterium RBG_16_48_16]|nr:MAG: peroxiredoxin [candidate division KSB1 bacterium RBG_16_48_16]
MPVRHASAVWEGDLKNGHGKMAFGSGAFEGAYSFSSRFEEGKGTNPEELIGAAHAGCFSMALSNILASAGFKPKRIRTNAHVRIDKVDTGFKILSVVLDTEGEVAGISQDEFQKHADSAKKGCPVSQALTGVEIKVNAILKG